MKRYEYILLEMSQTRQRAEQKISTHMKPLLIHLMAVEYFGDEHETYDFWIKEIESGIW